MSFIEVQKNNDIAVLMIHRGKVNALNGEVVEQMRASLDALKDDPLIKAIIITGAGKFFSFGFDIPEFLSFSKEQFTQFLINFTDLYACLFLYPKPVVAALNGHTIAGGCMLALACDHRIMVTGKAKISLNEITFGSSVFAGSAEMLRFWVGNAGATKVLYSGKMYTAEEAKEIGLVDELATDANLMATASDTASVLASTSSPAFASIKTLLRRNIAEEMREREHESIQDFVDIWYSKGAWENLLKIKIY